MSQRPRAAVPSPSTTHAVPVQTARGVVPAERREDDRHLSTAPDADAERGRQQPIERGRGGRRCSLRLEERRHGGRTVDRRRVAPSEVGEGAVECRTVVGLSGTPHAALEESRVPLPPSPVGSQVEQPMGDDVPLDLGAAAVNGGGAGVEELGPPALADRVVAEDHIGGEP